jgi:alkaline phosphatase
MPRYVDGFVIPIAKRKVAEYRKMARLGATVWREHGALEYFECVGDDLAASFGSKGFPAQLRLKRGETVVFAFIVFRSRAHRDKVNARVMKDSRMGSMPPKMPFDMKRVLYGGFRVLIEAHAS